jgi:hypothetical protein
MNVVEVPVVKDRVLSMDEIARNITSDDGIIYSASKDSIFAGIAVNTREQLLEAVQTAISGLNKAILYAYDELPDYSPEHVANYVSYYMNAISELEKIADCFREGE